MKIGLIRHFEVIHPYVTDRRMSPQECEEWIAAYDRSDVRIKPVDLGSVAWEKCYSSDLPRAFTTAQHVYKKEEIIVTPLLREVSILPVPRVNLRMPFKTWDSLCRTIWYFSHPSRDEGRKQFMVRLREFLQQLFAQPESNVLIVSHGALMWFLRSELSRLGFHGPFYTTAENGRLYVFECD